MALIADSDVTPGGYVGRPDAIRDAVAKKELTAEITLAGWPPTGAQRGVLRAATSGVSLSATEVFDFVEMGFEYVQALRGYM